MNAYMRAKLGDIMCAFAHRAFVLLGVLFVYFLAQSALFSAHAQDDPPLADQVKIEAAAGSTTFTMALDGVVEARVFALPNPYRVIIDLNEVNFQLNGQGVDARGGVINSYRFGLFAPGKSRIVMDVTKPVLVTRDIERQPDGSFKLTVRLQETDRATFDEAYAPSNGQGSRSSTPLNPGGSDGRGPVVIVIDPGHGGLDPGAVSGSGLREKEIVLSVGLRLRAALERLGGFEVHMTRDRDTFLSLAERVEYARSRRADLFISIHADSLRTQTHTVRGATIYTLSDRASDAQAAALAAAENRADLIAGVDVDMEQNEVADILIDLVRRETKNFSVFFARKFIEKMDGRIRLNSNPHRFAGFHVLKAPDVPSVLVELGYLSNAQDEALMKSPEWQERFAVGAAEAIQGYFQVRLAGNGG